MADKYPPGGVMFYETRKKNDRAPDLKGHIEVDQAMLDRLQAVIRESVDGRAKIDIGAWRKTSHTGKDFLSLKPDVRDGSFARNDRGGYTVRTRTEGPPASEPPKRGLPNLDDDIPF